MDSLLWLVARDNYPQRVAKLVGDGANPATVRVSFAKTKKSALMICIEQMKNGLVTLMLASRFCSGDTHIGDAANGLEATDIDGNTALHLAVMPLHHRRTPLIDIAEVNQIFFFRFFVYNFTLMQLPLLAVRRYD